MIVRIIPQERLCLRRQLSFLEARRSSWKSSAFPAKRKEEVAVTATAHFDGGKEASWIRPFPLFKVAVRSG